MQATKHTLTISVEVLDTMSIPALLIELANTFENENYSGSLSKKDGDYLTWMMSNVLVTI